MRDGRSIVSCSDNGTSKPILVTVALQIMLVYCCKPLGIRLNGHLVHCSVYPLKHTVYLNKIRVESISVAKHIESLSHKDATLNPH